MKGNREKTDAARRIAVLCLAAVLCSLASARAARSAAQQSGREATSGVNYSAVNILKQHPPRELYVPRKSWRQVALGARNRVMLSRKAFEALLKEAEAESEAAPPQAFLVPAAAYHGRMAKDVAIIEGEITIESLAEGAVAVPLTLAQVGVQAATLNGQPALMSRVNDHTVYLLVEAPGTHTLKLLVTTPATASAASQSVRFTLPTAAATSWRFSVPGNVELKSGAKVITREVKGEGDETVFQLAPPLPSAALTFTLNNRMLKLKSIVDGRSFVTHEVSLTGERQLATVAFDVAQGAAEKFRVRVPAGFSITEVASARLTRWTVEDAEADGEDANGEETDGQAARILTLHVREPVTDEEVFQITAVRTAAREAARWTADPLEPVGVAGHSALLAVFIAEQTDATDWATSGVIPTAESVMDLAPNAALESDVAVRYRPIAAYYVPFDTFELSADLSESEPTTAATLNLYLTVANRGLELVADVSTVTTDRFSRESELTLPAAWKVESVRGPGDVELAFEVKSNEPAGDARPEAATQTVVVLPPDAVAPSATLQYTVRATRDLEGWLSQWQERDIAMPLVGLPGADRVTGSVAAFGIDELRLEPAERDGLRPLLADERSQFGLTQLPSDVAYALAAQPYRLRLNVTRRKPAVTAETYNFFSVEAGRLAVRHEIGFSVRDASTPSFAFTLPLDTPPAITIRTLGGAAVKDFQSEEKDGRRQWTVFLERPVTGFLPLAVTYEQKTETRGAGSVTDGHANNDTFTAALPTAIAVDVAHQAGYLAVEGDPQLELTLDTTLPRVDVAELSKASYRVGRSERRLLGVYRYVGTPPKLTVEALRRELHALPPAVIERVELVTRYDVAGAARTAARYQLKIKTSAIALALPEGGELVAVVVDGAPVRPRTADGEILIPIALGEAATRDLRILFDTPAAGGAFLATPRFEAPRLKLPGESGDALAAARLDWRVELPPGMKAISTGGTVTPNQDDYYTRRQLARPMNPVAYAGGTVFVAGGGVFLPFLPAVNAAREAARRPMARSNGMAYHEPAADKAVAPETYYLDDDATYESEGDESGAAEGNDYAEGSELMVEPTVPMDPFGQPTPDEPMPTEESPPQAAEPPRAVPSPATGGGDRDEYLDQTAAFQGGAMLEDFEREQEGQFLEDVEDMDQIGPRRGDWEALGERRKKYTSWALEGMSSLSFDFEQFAAAANDKHSLAFTSLGAEPVVTVTMARRDRLTALAVAFGFALTIVGLLLVRCSAALKTKYVVLLVAAACLVPTVAAWPLLVYPFCIAALVVGLALIPVYLAIALCLRMSNRFAASAVIALVLCLPFAAKPSLAQENGDDFDKNPAVELPDDAVIVPYPDNLAEFPPKVSTDDELFVPLSLTQMLQAHIEAVADRKAKQPAPLPAALGEGAFTARLAGEENLTITGAMQVKTLGEKPVTLTLPLSGAFLEELTVDGHPAATRLIGIADGQALNNAPNAPAPMPQNQEEQAGPAVGLQIYIQQPGLHELKFRLRVPLTKTGGWRIASAVLPAPPAARLTVVAPAANTEIRFSGVARRGEMETSEANEKLVVALDPQQPLEIRWREKAALGEVDQSLTVTSESVFDVAPSARRLLWSGSLSFRGAPRDTFDFILPEGYRVDEVGGGNIRGFDWADDGNRLTVTLLRAADKQETVSLRLTKLAELDQKGLTHLGVPVVQTAGAALQRGRVTVRRATHVRIQSVQTDMRQTQLAAAEVQALTAGTDQANYPIGIDPYASFRFDRAPYRLELAVRPTDSEVEAEVRTRLMLKPYASEFESWIQFTPTGPPLVRARVKLGAGLTPRQIISPDGDSPAWTVIEFDAKGEEGADAEEKAVTVELTFRNPVVAAKAIVISGEWAATDDPHGVALPLIQPLDVAKAEGSLALQFGPHFDARLTGLAGCERDNLSVVSRWLSPEQLRQTRLAVRVSEFPYAGTLHLDRRESVVRCQTVTNILVTDRAIEETTLLEFTIDQAPVDRIAFIMPAAMADARVDAPSVEKQTVTRLKDRQGKELPWVRFELQLTDEVRGEYRVLLTGDRAMTKSTATLHLPRPLSGTIGQRYLLIETATRDEVLFEPGEGLEAVRRGRKEFREVTEILGGEVDQAFVVRRPLGTPSIKLTRNTRAQLQTVGANIGYATTRLAVDEHGGYRGEQVYRMDNRTEQFLEIELPPGARLWACLAQGRPVKTTTAPASARPTGAARLRVPLVKTAAGDDDYEVKLIYAGQMPSLRTFDTQSLPLITPHNLKPEFSEVRVKLPQGFNFTLIPFGGDMKTVTDADIQAGYVQYLTKKAQRFASEVESGDPYAASRVKGNLGKLQIEISQLKESVQSSLRHRDGAEQAPAQQSVQQALDSNDAVLENLEKSIEETEGRDATQFDNRRQLQERFRGQTNTYYNESLSGRGKNWKWADEDTPDNRPQSESESQTKAPAKPVYKGKGQVQEWLKQNKLEGKDGKDGGKERKPSSTREDDRAGRGDGDGGGGGRASGRYQYDAPQQPAAQPAPNAGGFVPGADQGRLLAQAQHELSQRAAQDTGMVVDRLGAQTPDIPTRNGAIAMFDDSRSFNLPGGEERDTRSNADDGNGRYMLGAGVDLHYAVTPASGETAAPGVPQGLASVDLDFDQIWEELGGDEFQEFKFTTPGRGGAITATPVSAPLAARLLTLLGLVVLFVVLYALWTVVRRVAPWVARRRVPLILVTVAAGLCLILTIFPVYALAVMITGIVILGRMKH